MKDATNTPVSTYIYCLKDPDSLIIKYIGKTINIRKRYNNHVCNYTGEKTLKNNWVKGLKSNGKKPILEVIEKCNEDNWIEREMYWIAYYKQLGYDLKNMTIGGEGLSGLKKSDDFKSKLRLRMVGSNNPFYGKKHTEETLKLIQNSSCGRNNPRAKYINVLDANKVVVFSGIRKEVSDWCRENGVCCEAIMKKCLYNNTLFNPKKVQYLYPNAKSYVGISFIYK